MGKEGGASFRFSRIVEPEDVLLVLWIWGVEGWVVRRSGSSPLSWVEPRADGSWPWQLGLVLLAAAFVIFSRGSCDTSIDTAVKRRALLTLPFFWLLSLIALAVGSIRGGEKSARHLGGDDDEWPMPAAPDWLRRVAATPIVLIGDSAFQAAFEREQGSFFSLGEGQLWGDFVSAGFLLVAPYLLFAVGPRVAAGSSGDWRVWTLRFAVYAAALFTGRQL